MQAFNISSKMLSEACEMASKMGALRGSLLRGKGNVSGFVGNSSKGYSKSRTKKYV